MKTSILLAATLAAAANLQAGGPKPADAIVYVSGDRTPPGSVDYPARATVAVIFSRAGFRVVFRDGEPKRNPVPEGAVVIRLRFTAKVPAQASPEALAYAQPFGDDGTAITVLYERIRLVAGRASRAQVVLAHVLAHEIGHILQRTNRHAPEGVMKAHWTGSDYDAMERKPLAFTSGDVELIHAGLTASALNRAEHR